MADLKWKVVLPPMIPQSLGIQMAPVLHASARGLVSAMVPFSPLLPPHQARGGCAASVRGGQRTLRVLNSRPPTHSLIAVFELSRTPAASCHCLPHFTECRELEHTVQARPGGNCASSKLAGCEESSFLCRYLP